MQFMGPTQVGFKADDNLFKNLEIQVEKLIEQIAEKSFMIIKNITAKVKSHEESIVEKHPL